MSRPIVIVGASLAGCSTAILLARQGHRVLVIDRTPDPSSFKRVCTHLIQNSAIPTLERLGLLEPMLQAGAQPSVLRIWFRSKWLQMSPNEASDPNGPTWNLNLRREVLDPMVRKLTSNTPGVELLLGASIESLMEERGRITGVRIHVDGKVEEIEAALVIGADGRYSRTAELAQIQKVTFPNIRGGWGAYYRNIELGNGKDTHFWLLEPDIAYSFPTDQGLTLLASITTQRQLPLWKSDIESNHRRLLENLPGGPKLERAERVSEYFGMIKTDGYYRDPASKCGMTLVGDAALTTDFVWGDGCSFAFRSAEMLADSIGAPSDIGNRESMDRAIQKYRRVHRRVLYTAHLQNTMFSRREKLEWVRSLVFSAAYTNQRIRHLMFRVQTNRVDGRWGGIELLLRSLLHQCRPSSLFRVKNELRLADEF